jgi:YjbE family integral membrane protein
VEFFSTGMVGALFQVVMIDLVLAGDNAVVIGLAAAGLAPALRRKAIIIGVLAATVLRICFALVATNLLAVVGLLLAGGLLLLWVCWKMWQELRRSNDQHMEEQIAEVEAKLKSGGGRKTLKQAVTQIVVADVSMSLDNVLAVAGAAQKHPDALIFGLALSVVLMGFASAFIAKLLERHRWIAYLGLAVIVFVAVRMIYHGADEVLGDALPALGLF